MAVSPTDEPGTLGRPEELARLLDPRRGSLPPSSNGLPSPTDEPAVSRIEWRPDSLFLLDLAGSTDPFGRPQHSGEIVPEYGFIGAGVRILQSHVLPPFFATVVTSGGSGYGSSMPVTFTSTDGNGSGARGTATVVNGSIVAIAIVDPGVGYTQAPTISFGGTGAGAKAVATQKKERHPAAAILPARLLPRSGSVNIQPLSTAVSPYLGFEFNATALDIIRDNNRQLSVAELVCFDVLSRRATSVATKTWYGSDLTGSGDDLIRAWAIEMQARFAADSPVAVVRLREVYAKPGDGGANGAVTIQYRFLASNAIIAPPSIALLAPPLRSEAAAIRYAEGQYGGPIMPPASVAPFELAPPQLDGVQPIRLDNRADANGKPVWPWGLSALRLSIRQLENAAGVAGPALTLGAASGTSAPAGRLWWQSLNHHVQYAVPEEENARKVLPTRFRAKAMSSLLPAWPNNPLPRFAQIRDALSPQGTPASTDGLFALQPILPGGYTTVLTGARPGATFAFREFIQTQDFDTSGSHGQDVQYLSVASGSVPVMHRTPRPILLPPNDPKRPDNALQTWASAFDTTSSANVQDSPVDSAYVSPNSQPLGLDLVLSAPDPIDPTSGKVTGRSITGGAIPIGTRTIDLSAKTPDASNWDGVLRFQADGHETPLVNWFPPETSTNPPPAFVTFNFVDPSTKSQRSVIFKLDRKSPIPAEMTSGTISFSTTDDKRHFPPG